MPGALKEKLRTRTDQIDRAVEDAQKGNPSSTSATEKPKKRQSERKGTGAPSFDLEAAIANLRAKIDATSDPDLKAKLEARIKALRENQ